MNSPIPPSHPFVSLLNVNNGREFGAKRAGDSCGANWSCNRLTGALNTRNFHHIQSCISIWRMKREKTMEFRIQCRSIGRDRQQISYYVQNETKRTKTNRNERNATYNLLKYRGWGRRQGYR